MDECKGCRYASREEDDELPVPLVERIEGIAERW